MNRLFCSLATTLLALSAMAQQRPPEGYNYAQGDFNGDGKQEYVYFVPPKDAEHWDELDDLDVLNGVLKFTDPAIPEIFVKQCVMGAPRNLGDLNGDGTDEIGIQPGWVTSNWQLYRIFALKPEGWIDAVEPFTIYLDADDFDQNPPVKKLSGGRVRITTYEWLGDTIVPRPKAVKVK
ncbi:MAG: hypothetical protein Q4B68_02730 [Bacteroidales bacterium]|nr:hypothetical protein [Bacteroidales bacterium]